MLRRPITILLMLTLAISAVSLPVATSPQTARAAAAGNAFFQQTWERTDEPVAAQAVSRTWVWGPEAFTDPVGEAYADAPGGVRLVQYFDKSRMEINDPAHDPTDLWFVTNGLLAKELITGALQTGDDSWEERGAAQVNIAGDPLATTSPTYASFAGQLGAPALADGAAITQTISRDGTLDCCVDDSHGVTAGPLADLTGHRVASVFWDYLNSSGTIVERTYRTSGALFANPYYATGYPIAEAAWAWVPVAGVEQWVLVQPFERRVLTYTPGNATGWQVEMGNVGQHYYQWRYSNGSAPLAAPGWQLPAAPKWTPAGQAVDIPDVDVAYRLAIHSANVDTGAVDATATIDIQRFNSAQPSTLYLQIVPAAYGYFTLDALTVDGQAVGPEWIDGGFILGVPLPPGASAPLTIGVDFRLSVGQESSGWGGTSLDSGVLRLGYWFPIISDRHVFSETLDPSQSRVADYEVTIDVASDVVVAHTGTESGRQSLPDGRMRYALSATNVRDFALALSRRFSVQERTLSDGTFVRYYSHPSSPGGAASVAFDAAEETVSLMNGLVGPYPYPTLSIVDVGPRMPGGLEFPSLIYINGAYAPLDRLVVHEIAHQWMYAIIGNRTLVDGWIDEGAAEFFERGLLTGFTEVPSPPDGGYQFWLDADARELAAADGRQWYYSIYEQGARFYYQVAWQMGWDAFWDAWRDLYQRHAFDVVTPVEMLSIFQSHSPTDLRPLYDDYFRYPWIWDLLPAGG
ncbi:MAG: hypothetical protein M9890_11385 [Thermomicrobiales bacterium]|nr:hypothetical protein [Thermomicrobiales bacterium]